MVVNFMDKGGLTMMYMFNDLLKIDPNAEEQKDKIKLIVASILVIDDCYVNPIAVRNFLLTTPCFLAKHVDVSNYPGYRSETRVQMGLVNLVNTLIKQYYPLLQCRHYLFRQLIYLQVVNKHLYCSHQTLHHFYGF